MLRRKHEQKHKPKAGQSVEACEITAVIQSDPGNVREVNEDCGRFIKPMEPAVFDRKGSLAIVADGMGGHSAGEVASTLAVETISRVYYSVDGLPGESLRKAFEEANQKIYEASLADKNLAGMGTTATALAVYGTSAIAAHVGDSRLYLLREGEIYLMTEDHSAVREMVKLGIISAEQARHHEDKNVIVRALGTAPRVEVSFWESPLAVRDDDQFLLCSDGLYDLVEDSEIRDMVLSAPDNHAACESLIEMAKRRGGYDNITVGILSIKPAGYVETRSPRETREVEVIV
jgi:serine/threonine protein phosphatase PrpC